MAVAVEGHGYRGVSEKFLHELRVHAPRESRVAHVCRKSWKRTSSNPARLSRGLKDRLSTVLCLKGVPVSEANMRPLSSQRVPLSPTPLNGNSVATVDVIRDDIVRSSANRNPLTNGSFSHT